MHSGLYLYEHRSNNSWSLQLKCQYWVVPPAAADNEYVQWVAGWLVTVFFAGHHCSWPMKRSNWLVTGHCGCWQMKLSFLLVTIVAG